MSIYASYEPFLVRPCCHFAAAWGAVTKWGWCPHSSRKEGSSPCAFSSPGMPSQKAENWCSVRGTGWQWRFLLRILCFFKFAGLLGSRNPPLKDLWVDSKPCGCKVEAWCDCVGTGRVFWSSYCHKLSCPISKMICAIHCWLFLSIH